MANNELKNFLKELGYNIMAAPNSGIKIFDILIEKERKPLELISDLVKRNSKPVARVGSIKNFFSNENVSLPAEFTDEEQSSFTNKSSDLLEIGTSVAYSDKIINALGGEVKAKLSLKDVAKTKFEFQDVKSNFYAPVSINDFINSGIVNYDSSYLNDLKKGKLYILFEIVKTNSFSIEHYSSSDNKVEIEVKPAKDAIGGGVKVINTTTIDSKIYYKSDKEPVIFGFKAAQIIFIGRFYKINKPIYKKLKAKGLPEEILDLISSLPTKDYNDKDEFIEKLVTFGIKREDIDKYDELFENYCGYDKFKLKEKEGLIHRDEKYPVNTMQSEEAFIDIEI